MRCISNRAVPFGWESSTYIYDYNNSPNATGIIVPASPATNPAIMTTPVVISFVYTQTGSPSFFAYSNGILISSNTSISPAPVGNDIGTLFCLAGRGDAGGAAADCVIGEVIVYNTSQTALERQQVEGYLAYKWGMTLPLSHLYYGRSSAISTYTIAPILAQFNTPGQLCIDRTNINIYIADSGNNVIRQINLSTASTSTFVGGFNGLLGICINEISSKLYVADSGNNVIKEIDIANQTSGLLAGSTSGFADGIAGAAQFTFPVYVIIDSIGSNLYISDYNNNRIRRIVLSNAAVSTLVGSGTAASSNGIGTAATFNAPTGITLYSNSLFTGEFNNPQVRMVNLTTSNVTTFVGSNTSGYLDTPFASYDSYNTPQTLNLYSNALYTTISLYSNSIMVQIPLTSYPSTTFTFSNPITSQIQNSTGRQLTIAVTGSTVTNPTINSLPNIPDILTLHNNGESYTLF
jgi:hypothetical protein